MNYLNNVFQYTLSYCVLTIAHCCFNLCNSRIFIALFASPFTSLHLFSPLSSPLFTSLSTSLPREEDHWQRSSQSWTSCESSWSCSRVASRSATTGNVWPNSGRPWRWYWTEYSSSSTCSSSCRHCVTSCPPSPPSALTTTPQYWQKLEWLDKTERPGPTAQFLVLFTVRHSQFANNDTITTYFWDM